MAKKTITGLKDQAVKGLAGSCLLLVLGMLPMVLRPEPVAAAGPQNSAPPPLVTVIRVAEQDINPQTEYVGHVEAVQTADLQARVSGFLEQIQFKEGSDVQAGELLYLVEPAPYRMKVAVNRARVTRAEAVAREAEQRLQRIENVGIGGIPITELETAKATAQKAQADLQEAQALLALAEIDLGYTQISAPISGRIGGTSLSRGNLVGPSSGTLARIVQLDPIRVLFSISENEIQPLQAAQQDALSSSPAGIMRPRLKLADGSLLENLGRIDFVDNRVDPTTGTVAVRALFDNPSGLLLPGQYVRLVVSRARESRLPVVPQAAVLEDREGRYLLLVDGQNQVELRRITTGAAVGPFWAVASGLAAGEQVIVEGLQKVRPGQTVKTLVAPGN
jgi:membrane fusion protein (multidrug efflux system)